MANMKSQRPHNQSRSIISTAATETPPTLVHQNDGTPTSPFLVEFAPFDPTNPTNFSPARKWLITSIGTFSVLAITLTSSAYSSCFDQIHDSFQNTTNLVFALGIALFVLGFALGPAFWAPLSELYGRRPVFIVTHACVVAIVAASAGARSMGALLGLRFLAGVFGASPLTNTGGLIADMFTPVERGFVMSVFAAAPSLGPLLGPVFGGFVSETIGWRWVQGICAAFIGVVLIFSMFLLPETYGPVLLRRKAEMLSNETGEIHISVLEANTGVERLSNVFKRTLKRPWVLLFSEPIVLIASSYTAILYGIIYMFMGAFPIIYQQDRHWSTGLSGVAFIGLILGTILGLLYTLYDNRRYEALGKRATPESRLLPCMVGAIAIPIGMFGFAWSNGSEVHWSASIILSSPFGFGSVLVFLSIINYLVDTYTIYAASVLAGGAILRALFGFAFPLLTEQIYRKLGIHWASSLPAFLTLACLPFPFVMYRYGPVLRMKYKYARKAALLLSKMKGDRRDNDNIPSS